MCGSRVMAVSGRSFMEACLAQVNSPTDDSTVPVFRFAPSPNGLLHLGHAYSALANLARARAAGGKMLLRIEDIDRQRCTPQNEVWMLEDLEWIGFEWDEAPVRQSASFDFYRTVLDELISAGLAYPAILSRCQIAERIEELSQNGRPWPTDPDGVALYPGTERELGEPDRQTLLASGDYALRLDTDRAMSRIGGPLYWYETGFGPLGETGRVTADPKIWGDVILGRKDTPSSYHLAATLDDARQGISDVVRGRDLFWSTAMHRLLQELLGLSVPRYHHHDLILDPDGRKLSKSRGDTALRHLREAGLTRADIVRMIGLS
jgi:glutamyl-Q tRNA(Asp) synthetase